MPLRTKTGKIDRIAKKLLEGRLDEHWRGHIRERDNWTCRKCGKMKNRYSIEAHHIAKRRQVYARWEPLNGLSLCLPCHQWAELHPDAARVWACDELGEDTYDAVVTLARGTSGYRMHDLEDLEEAFKSGAPVSRVAEMLQEENMNNDI